MVQNLALSWVDQMDSVMAAVMAVKLADVLVGQRGDVLVEMKVATTAESSVEVRVASMAGQWVGTKEVAMVEAMVESTVEQSAAQLG